MAVTKGPAYRLETPRLLLRCWAPEDALRLRPALDDSADHLRPWIPFMKDEPRTLEETAEWLAGIRAMFDRREHFRYAVWNSSGQQLIGENMLLDRVGPDALEIGYLTHRAFDGQGYASEATLAMIRAGFELHGAQRLEIHCATGNAASAAIPRRFGFHLDGTLRGRATNADGEVHDLMIWSLLRDEYAAGDLGKAPLKAWDALGRRLI